MSDLITYDDKIRLKSQNVSEKYKVTAGDMNEIKSVVNNNAEDVGDISTLTTTDKTSVVNAVNELNTGVNELNAPEKWVAVGIEKPTDGRRVWFKKSKNLIGLGTQLNGYVDAYNLGFTVSANSVGYFFETSKLPDTITFSCVNGNRGHVCYFNEIPQSGATAITRNPSNDSTRTITIDKTYSYVHIQFSYNNLNVTNIQVEKGSTATTYEPYIEPTIYLDEEELYSEPKVLYENSSGTSSDFTLSESIENYSYIEVEYQLGNYTIFKGCTKLIKNSSTSAIGSLSAVYGNSSSNGLLFFGARLSITGVSATIDRNYGLNVSTTGTTYQGNLIQVTRVLGYK